MEQGARELQRLAVRARAEHDFTGAAALSEAASDLEHSLQQVRRCAQPFSFLDGDMPVASRTASTAPPSALLGAASRRGGVGVGEGVEVSERIAREGSAAFIDADFLFDFACGSDEGHSIGSLAIVAGAGAVLRDIRAHWPGLSALQADAGPYGDAKASSFADAMDASFFAHSGGGGSGGPDGGSGAPINFRDANQLRLIGFDARSLRQAGFPDLEVLTAGFTASQLREAGFTTDDLRASGLTDSTLRVVGYHVEQQARTCFHICPSMLSCAVRLPNNGASCCRIMCFVQFQPTSCRWRDTPNIYIRPLIFRVRIICLLYTYYIYVHFPLSTM